MLNPKRIGISLSGGGYRATAFHLGTLKKLQQLNILERVNVISTISGGSITGACYCSRKGDFDEFYTSLYKGLQEKNVIRKLLFSWLGLRMLIILLILLGSFGLLFTRYPWIFPIIWIILFFILFKFQFGILPISKRIEEIYDQFFYNKTTLGELPDHPWLVVGSTNLQTARPFSFSRDYMGDSTYAYLSPAIVFQPGKFPLSRAVMASSCVPFAFTPIRIAPNFFKEIKDANRVHPLLVDGGVYDNQGIHKIMQGGRFDCDVVVTSDAGCGKGGELTIKNTFTLLLETVNVFMSRIKNAQMVRDVYENSATYKRQVAYLSLGWDIENCIPGFVTNLEKKLILPSLIEAHQLKPEWVADPTKYRDTICSWLESVSGYKDIIKPSPEEKAIARAVSTNLTSLSKLQVDCLVKQAMALTELQVKLYCPSLINSNE